MSKRRADVGDNLLCVRHAAFVSRSVILGMGVHHFS
jgi:hypothetical protein